MARITTGEVERVAALARLDLSSGEARRMSSDLDAILDYVEQLRGIDTAEVLPTSHVLPRPTPLRDDEVAPGLTSEVAMANAPERAGSAFAVPKVLDSEQEG